MNPQTTAPTQAPQAPATLDGVSIQDCQFTESVGKREPRPPLYLELEKGTPIVTDRIWLRLPGRRVYVKARTLPPGMDWRPGHGIVGAVLYGEPKGPAYTGHITPAMWAIIRKYWNP